MSRYGLETVRREDISYSDCGESQLTVCPMNLVNFSVHEFLIVVKRIKPWTSAG
jgi:hypothetical protein